MAGLYFESGVDDNFENDVKKMVRQIDVLASRAKEKGGEIDSTFKKVGARIAAYFGTQRLLSFGKDIINVRAEFQKFGIVLENTLGSKVEADNALQMVSDFAANTPFQLTELTDSFIKLTNQGFQPSFEELTKLGDLASSTGKGFGQLSEAIIDAQTGEFERLKEFGIKASKDGDKVSFSFKGVETTVRNTADSIRQYIIGLGDLQGVSGANAKIAESLSGQISNLGDAWDQMLNQIGAGSEGAISTGLASVKFLIDNYQTVAKVLGTLIAAYGSYKIATFAVNSAQKIQAALALQTATAQRVAALTGKQVAASNIIMANSFKALKAAFLSNPIGIIVTGMTLLVPLIAEFVSETDQAGKVQETLNGVMADAQKSIAGQKVELDKLLTIAKDENRSLEDRQEAISQLNKISPEYLGNLNLQNINTQEATKATDAYSEALLKNARVQAASEKLVEVQKQLIDLRESGAGAEVKWYQQLYNTIVSGGNLAVSTVRNVESGIVNATDKQKELLAIQEALLKIATGDPTATNKTPVTTGLTEQEKEKRRKEYEKSLKDFDSYLKDQKKAYEQFNSDVEGLTGYRLKIVQDEYKGLTEQGNTYLEFLNSLLSKEKDLKKQEAIKSTIADVIFEQNVQAQKIAQDAFDDETDRLKKLEETYASYLQKKEKLTIDYNKIASDLRAAGNEDAAKQSEKALADELDRLDQALLSTNSSFQQWLKKDLPKLAKEGVGALKDELSKVQVALTTEGLNPEQVVVYKGKIQELQAELDKLQDPVKSVSDNWKDALELMNGINSLIGDISKSFDGLNDNTKRVLETITSVAGGVINIGTAFNALQSATGTLETASASLSLIGAGLQVFSAISKSFKDAAEQRLQAQLAEYEQIQKTNLALIQQNALYEEGNKFFSDDKWGKALAGLEAYNFALGAQEELLQSISDRQASADQLTVYGTVKDAFRDIRKNAEGAATELERALSSIAVKTRDRSGIANFFGAKDEFKSLLEVYPNLIKANGDLDSTVLQTIVDTADLGQVERERLTDLLELTRAAEQAYSQFGEYISSIFGGVADDVTSAFLEMYKGGDDAMMNLQQSFSDMIESFTKDAIEFAFLQPYLNALNESTQALGEQFAKGDITAEQLQSSIINTLGNFYNQLNTLQPEILQAFENADALAAAAGFDQAFNAPVDTTATTDTTPIPVEDVNAPLSTAGQIQQAITEETGSELVGRINAMVLSNQQIANYSADALDYAIQNLVYMKAIKTNTDYLPAIEENTRKTYEKLQNI